MRNGKRPFVIAIAAVSGGGKTTTTTQLHESLPNASSLYFDDYDFDGPDDMIRWVDNGADYDEWNLDPLIRDLKALLNEPLDYIVVDFPFAYKHAATKSLEHIMAEMNNYVSQGRRGYLEMLHSIKPTCDMIVDGTLPVHEIVSMIIKCIKTDK